MILENVGAREGRPKIPQAKDSDKYTCSRSVTVDVRGDEARPGWGLKLLWGTTGFSEFWVQLSSEHLEFIVESIQNSPVQEKSKRPKFRRGHAP